MSTIKTAIITSCYNVNSELLNKHFFSIKMQGKDEIDSLLHIVVDDYSTLNSTKETLCYHALDNKEHTVLISKKENSGPGAARNRAIEIIKKIPSIEYICLLDADDYFEKDSLLIRKLFLQANSQYIAVYGDKYTAKYENKFDIIDNKDIFTEISKTPEISPEYNKARLFRECYIPSCSVMFRAKPFLESIKSFREDVRLCEDWLIWRKLALLGDFKKLNMPIYTQTLHGNNLTTNINVLNNHYNDMITTQLDLDNWISENSDKVKL